MLQVFTKHLSSPSVWLISFRSLSFEGTTAIDGIPFKFGSNVLLEDLVCPFSTASTEEMMSKIKSFNWDDYEYSFELEKSIMREFSSTVYNQA